QAPVINNYVGTKTVDTSAGAQSGRWLLFNLSDVVDPEGEPITKANITLSGDAAWVGDSVYISYNFDQGKFGSKEATVTITDPVDASITSVYEFNLAAVASVGLHLSETRAATDANPLYVDFANNTVSSTDSPLDVATIIGEGPYNVTYNFSAGDDAQEMGTHSRPVYWQIPDGAAASDFWTTEPNEYPVYVNGVKQSGKYWDTTKAGLTSAEAPEDTTGFVTSYPKMVATAGTDANNPVTVTVTEDGKMTMQIAPYAPALDLDGSVTISNGENSVTIPVAILNAYESPTTFDLQYFVSTKAFTNTATVDRDGWFNEYQSQMDAQLLDSVDTQVTDSTGAALYWDPDCIGEDYWTTTPNEYPVYYGGNQQQDEETGLPLYWDTTKVSVDNNTTNVRPSSSRDRYPVMERSQASVAKKTSDIAYGSDHYLNIFASDSWNQGNLRLNSVCTLAFKVNFGAPVTLKDTTSPASMGTNAADWNEDHSEVTFLMINLNTSADGDGPGIVEDSYKMLLAAKYAYTSDFSSGTPTVTIELQAIQRNMDSGVTNLNTEQVIAGWADTCNPNPALYGTEGAKETLVEGTGVYMVVSTADEADSAAALPESESWINEWQSHYVDLY
ncbi:MAG: hypothetical protein IKW80_01250, partial [Thermoguttaceae bacterium]|nr:hypothetical protein [Thermoguttaceae bacterium]